MHDSIHYSLFTACAGGLQRTGRVVHPDIDARYQQFCNGDIIVWYEYYFADKLWHLGYVDNSLDQILTGLICWVCFSCKKELNRTIRVVDQVVQPFEVAEEQSSSFVCCKAAGESYGKDIVAQSLFNLNDLLWRVVIGSRGIAHVLLNGFNEFMAQVLSDTPDLIIRDFIDTIKAAFIVVVGFELLTEDLCMNLFPLRSSPCGVMDSVGDMANM